MNDDTLSFIDVMFYNSFSQVNEGAQREMIDNYESRASKALADGDENEYWFCQDTLRELESIAKKS